MSKNSQILSVTNINTHESILPTDGMSTEAQMASVNGGALFKHKSSDAQFRSVSSTGYYDTRDFSTIKSHQYQYRTSDANPIMKITFQPTTITKTTSFMEIHAEVANNIQNSPHFITSRHNSGRPGSNIPESELPTGVVPVGDMLLPMLAMALIYVISKIFRNRKTSQAL